MCHCAETDESGVKRLPGNASASKVKIQGIMVNPPILYRLVTWGLVILASLAAGRPSAATDEVPKTGAQQALEKGRRLLDAQRFDEARGIFEAFLKKQPGGPEADELRWGIIESFLRSSRCEEALEVYRQMEKDAPSGTNLPGLLFRTGDWFCYIDRPRDGIHLLQEVIRRWPESGFVPMANLELGKAHEAMGQEAEMVACLEKAASAKPWPQEPRVSGLNPYDVTVEAGERLGEFYVKKGRWADGLRVWLNWKPHSWCGTCEESMLRQRALGILRCQTHLDIDAGHPLAAIKRLEEVALKPGSGGLDEDLLVLLVDLCQKNGNLAEVEAKLQPKARPAGTSPSYFDMIHMAEKADFEPLWRQVGQHNQHPFIHGVPLAGRVLATQGDRVRPFLMQKLKDAQARLPEAGDTVWVIVLLGGIQAPETKDLAMKGIESEGNVHCLKDYFYALALMGTDEAYAVIRRHAEQSTDNLQTAAQEVLKRYAKPGSASLRLP